MPTRIDNWIWFNGRIIGRVYNNSKYLDGSRVITPQIIEHGEGFVKTEKDIYYLGVMSDLNK